MAQLNYTLTFHSDWHCGSGLAAGAESDALVVRDERGLPYVPGRTIKGLLREAVETLHQLAHPGQPLPEEWQKVWGLSGDDTSAGATPARSVCFFTNACLSDEEQEAIVAQRLTPHLYRNIARTAISEETGVALDHSLRRLEVVLPCTLHGTIDRVPESLLPTLTQALGWTKCLGSGRHRGLGRCTFTPQ